MRRHFVPGGAAQRGFTLLELLVDAEKPAAEAKNAPRS
jgi:hypothetical protein